MMPLQRTFDQALLDSTSTKKELNMLSKSGLVVAMIGMIQGFPQDVIQFPEEEASFAGSQLVGNRIPGITFYCCSS